MIRICNSVPSRSEWHVHHLTHLLYRVAFITAPTTLHIIEAQEMIAK